MGKFITNLTQTTMSICVFPFVIASEVFKGLFEHDNVLTHPSNAHPGPIVRAESYRTLKRRNRLMRKFDHKKGD